MKNSSHLWLIYFSLLILVGAVLSACGGGGSGSGSGSGGGGGGSGTNASPTISGTPPAALVDAPFVFVPTSEDVDGDTLTFSIQNPPAWADFDTATGTLSGTPDNMDLGISNDIVISVTDGIAAPVLLPAFDLEVSVAFNETLFADPTVSSASDSKRRFQANDGVDTDQSNGWIADSADTTPEPWIRLDFDSPKSIVRVTLSDLIGAADQVEELRVEFYNEGVLTHSFTMTDPLPNDGTAWDIPLNSTIQTDSIKVILVSSTRFFGLAEIAAYSALDPDQGIQVEDLFNDGNANGWFEVDNCGAGFFDWGVGIDTIGAAPDAYIPQAYQQTGDCGTFTPAEGVEIGTYSLLNVPDSSAGVDLRLRILADDTGNPSDLINGSIGLMFDFVDNDNYYRMDINGLDGQRKLWKRQAGVFTELSTSPQSFTLGKWFNLRIVQHNGLVLVYMDGVQIMAVENATLSGDRIALFCARNESCSFDNVIILDPPATPVVGINISDGIGHKSGEYFVDTDGVVDLSAVVTDTAGLGGVEFVADEDSSPVSLTDFVAPYGVQFNSLMIGNHDFRAYLLDGAAQRLTDADATAGLPLVGIGGFHLVGLGDGVTSGLRDDVPGDDSSLDGRNTGGGYQSVLNNLMTAAAGNDPKPVSLLDEGNPGETSAEGALRIAAVVDRTPEAQGYLVLYGANDATASGNLPSGLGLNPGDAGYAGSFKSNMQQIITVILSAGKQVFPGKTLPQLPDDARNVALQEYNQVIDELVAENGIAGYTPPDFFAHFMANQSELDADGIHPNGTGYQSMALLWCQSLNGHLGISCP